MKNNYYSVFSNGKSYDNLIDLRSRPLEERREIARLGGLARQKQRREQLAFKKTLEAFFEVDDFIGNYNKKSKHRNFAFSRNFSKSGANYFNCLIEDTKKALENYDKELQKEEAKRQKRKKAIRKKINRRYYLKRKKRLKKT